MGIKRFAAAALAGLTFFCAASPASAARMAEAHIREVRREKDIRESRMRAEEAARAERARRDARRAAEAEAKAAAAQAETKAEPAGADGGAARDGECFLAKYLRSAREEAEKQAVPKDEAGEARSWRALYAQPMKAWPVEAADTGGTLLFSDSPEYVREPGILYSDIVKGDARVFYYHVNETKKPYKVAVVLENDSGQYAVVHVTRRGLAAPSPNYLEVGKGLQARYFGDGQTQRKLYIGSGEKRLLSEDMDRTVLAPGDLVAGVFDFYVSAPVRASVLFYPARENPLAYLPKAKILPADEHRLRGTFVGMDRILRAKRAYHPDRDGLCYIALGDDAQDPFMAGVDATDGSLVKNYGNYGVLYRIELPIAGRGGARFWMSPMGGVYAGVVRAEAASEPGARLFDVPDGRLCFGEASAHPRPEKDGRTTLLPQGELASLGACRAKSTVFFEFSPPGASNLPALLILAPDNLKVTREKAPEESPTEKD